MEKAETSAADASIGMALDVNLRGKKGIPQAVWEEKHERFSDFFWQAC